MAATFAQIPEFLRFACLALLLLMTFVGAGLYCRGIWVYFLTVRWLHRAEQAPIRKRYKSSALAAIFREPDLSTVRSQLLLALAGPVLFAVGGGLFNLLRSTV